MASSVFRAQALLLSLAACASVSAQQTPAPGYAQQPVYPQGSYPAPQSSYPPAQGTYPAPQPAYPATQPAYPATQPAYPATQPAYPPPQSPYPQTAYPPPAQQGYQAPQPGYRPPQPGYPQSYPQQPAYSPPASTAVPSNYQQPAATAPPPATGWQPPQAQPVYAQPPQSYPPATVTAPAALPATVPAAQPLANYTPATTNAAAAHPAETPIEPYHKHEDTRHGHDQVYPDRGALVRELPRSAIVVNYAGSSYWFCDGVWFEPRGPAFLVTAPPIGLVVPTLPTFATAIVSAGRAYLYANDVYYRPRPDLGGYEVVNDPEEPAVEAGAASNSPVQPAALSTVSTATVAAASAPALAATPVAAPAPLASVGPPGGTVNSPYPYPKNGQTPEEQARDRYDCYRFAVTQTGYDPMRSSLAASPQNAERDAAYERAQAACYEGRGYTVR